MNPDDRDAVALQLGREPRGTWRVVRRCPHGAPAVLAMAPELESGAPFPTTFWLTCPACVVELHDRESAGEHAGWSERAGREPGLADALRASDAAYREARRSEGAGGERIDGGVAGERDPLRVKCLHARAAAALAGIPDPVGESYAPRCLLVMDSCDGSRCRPPATGNDTGRHSTEGTM